jgi:hypothetical protein
MTYYHLKGLMWLFQLLKDFQDQVVLMLSRQSKHGDQYFY